MCLGSLQITRRTPPRLSILQLLQIFLTDDRTFIKKINGRGVSTAWEKLYHNQYKKANQGILKSEVFKAHFD